MSEESLSLVSFIHKINLLQEERDHFYKLFNEGHKMYLNTAPNYHFSKFRILIQELTQEFKRISLGIIAIEKQIRYKGYTDIADIVCKLQENEKLKLELSAKLQIAKQEAIDNPDLPEKWNEVALIKHDLQNITQVVNEKLETLKYEMQEMVKMEFGNN